MIAHQTVMRPALSRTRHVHTSIAPSFGTVHLVGCRDVVGLGPSVALDGSLQKHWAINSRLIVRNIVARHAYV